MREYYWLIARVQQATRQGHILLAPRNIYHGHSKHMVKLDIHCDNHIASQIR